MYDSRLSLDEEMLSCWQVPDNVGICITTSVQQTNAAGKSAANSCGECEMYVEGWKGATGDAHLFGYCSGCVERKDLFYREVYSDRWSSTIIFLILKIQGGKQFGWLGLLSTDSFIWTWVFL